MIQFGAQLGMHPPAEQFALVRRLEALGFDSGPAIWIGGRSEAALPRAARHGDGWVSYVVQPERHFLLNAICEPAEERAQLERMAAEVIPRFRPR